jgi:hypothetical protein
MNCRASDISSDQWSEANKSVEGNIFDVQNAPATATSASPNMTPAYGESTRETTNDFLRLTKAALKS